jgi:hypothetical protein
MALVPFKPSDYVVPAVAQPLSSGFVIRSKADNPSLKLIGWAAAVIGWYGFAILNLWGLWAPANGNEIDFKWFIGLVLVWMLALSVRIWWQKRNLEPAELWLSTYPIVRGQPLELRFVRRLKNGARLPSAGTIQWRLTCAECTKTVYGTDTTFSHKSLWSADFSELRLTAGITTLEARASVEVPANLPATLAPREAKTHGLLGMRTGSTSSWIEWQLQAAPSVSGFNDAAKFSLRVR